MAAVNSRTRMLRMPIACGESSVSGTMKVVSSTSHREMPSTPRWKRMPSGAIHDLVDLHLEAGLAGVEAGEDRQRHHEGDQRGQKAEAAMDRFLLARHQHHQDGAEEREQRDPAEDAHQRTVTFCLTDELVFQCVSLTSTRMV